MDVKKKAERAAQARRRRRLVSDRDYVLYGKDREPINFDDYVPTGPSAESWNTDEYGRKFFSWYDLELKNTPKFARGNNKRKLDRLSADNWNFNDGQTDFRFGRDMKRERIILGTNTNVFEPQSCSLANVHSRVNGTIAFTFPEALRGARGSADNYYDADDATQPPAATPPLSPDDAFPVSDFYIMPNMWLDVRIFTEWAGIRGHHDSETSSLGDFDEAPSVHAPAARIDLTRWAHTMGTWKDDDAGYIAATGEWFPQLHDPEWTAPDPEFRCFGRHTKRTINLDHLQLPVANASELCAGTIGVEYVLWMYEMPAREIDQRWLDATYNEQPSFLASALKVGDEVELPFTNIEVDLKFSGHLSCSRREINEYRPPREVYADRERS